MRRSMAPQERTFGLSVGLVSALVAAYFLWRGRTTSSAVFGLLAVGLILPALTMPSLLRVPNVLWRELSRGLGWLNARILLSAVFLLLLTPVGLVFRLAGRDPLGRGSRARESGWVPYPERQRSPKHYERMY